MNDDDDGRVEIRIRAGCHSASIRSRPGLVGAIWDSEAVGEEVGGLLEMLGVPRPLQAAAAIAVVLDDGHPFDVDPAVGDAERDFLDAAQRVLDAWKDFDDAPRDDGASGTTATDDRERT